MSLRDVLSPFTAWKHVINDPVTIKDPFTREAAIARQLTTRHALQIGSDAVQLLGGHGYVKEHPVERWYRDLRLAGIVEGGLAV